MPPCKDYQLILHEYQLKHGKPLSPIRHRSGSLVVPETTICPQCNAPHIYLYYNDGKKRTQLRCKVCSNLFPLNQRRRKTKYFCPYCHHALFKWKQRQEVTIYKCDHGHCPHRIDALNRLNPSEGLLQKSKLSQFKINYQYREYHFTQKQLQHSSPVKPKVDLTNIYNSQNVLGLILTFYVSFAISARKTALMLRLVFNIKISYQTVLNYAEAAAHYCHHFNWQHKGPIDPISAGDEAYIKIKGNYQYVFFFISSKSLKITAYHVADNRGTLPATTAMFEAIRTADPKQTIILVTDGNPSYPAGIHFMNAKNTNHQNIEHRKVIGLQNLDKESEAFRPFKQIIERLNRTYKYHVKPAHGFNTSNGAIALTTLFVTHYNFLRPHMSLNYKPPIHLEELQALPTIQAQWGKILSLAA